MSLRAALVDDLKTVTAVTDIVSDRITDMFYEFEGNEPVTPGRSKNVIEISCPLRHYVGLGN